MANAKCIEKVSAKTEPELEQEHDRGRQIGIMGGTFNPVHIAHLVAAEQAMTKLKLDEVWFIPDNIPPHKNAPLTFAKDRATMLDLATRNPTVLVSNNEREPKFDVIMIIVFLKSTFLPFESVKNPSSNT